jgi:hypothetical protein
MNIVKALENIGENTTMNQHDSLEELLSGINIQKEIISNIQLVNSDLICGMHPEDDDPDESED